tara:strand:+ start:2553 stop:3458 length:906 start_codon:yes stop_codon:yes gene_type:complete
MIFCVGSINLDFITRVEKLPEAGETILGEDIMVFPGGKGANQALAASRAGSCVKLIGAVGRDQNKQPALSNIKESDIDTSCIFMSESNTGVAFIATDSSGENQIVVSQGANCNLSEENVASGLTNIKKKDILLIQQEMPLLITKKAIEIAAKKEATIILNTAPYSDDSYQLSKSASIVITNEIEFENFFADFTRDQKNYQNKNIKEKLSMLSKSMNKIFVVTLGGKGLVCMSGDSEIALKAAKVKVTDTVGAGDTFCGYFSSCIDQGKKLEDALILANNAAAIACTKVGAQNSIPMLRDII